MGSFISEIGDTISSAVSDVGNIVGDIGSGLGNLAQSAFSGITQALSNPLVDSLGLGMLTGGASLGGNIVTSGLGLGGGGTGLGVLGSIFSGVSGALDLLNSRKLMDLSKNPLAAYGGQYAQQIAALEANPSLITQYPQYKANLQAVQRTDAAQGYGGSGRMAADVAQVAGQTYDQQIAQLLGLVQGGLPTGAQVSAASGAAGLESQGLGMLTIATNPALQNAFLTAKGGSSRLGVGF